MRIGENELKKFNNRSTNIRLYLSRDIKINKKYHVWSKTSIFCHLLRNVIMDVIP